MPQATEDELVGLAEALTPGQRDVIEKIGAAGANGLSTFGWATNWFTALFMSKKHPGLIVTGMDDNHAKLGPEGERLYALLRASTKE
jgi:hypothetical protein